MSESNERNNTDQHAPEALSKNESRYFKMIDEVEDYAIILLDEKGYIQNWNKGACKIKLYTKAEVVGKNFSIFYLPDDRAADLPNQLLAEAVQHGKVFHEGWRLRKDGTRFWGSTTLTALHNDSNEIIGFSKVTRDLSERKLAEDKLRESAKELQLTNEALRFSEERYHKMIAEVQDYAILLLDTNGNIQNWNAGAAKIKGYAEHEIVGKNFRLFYTDEDRAERLPERLLNLAAEQGKAIHEGWRVTKSGSRFWGNIVITALHNKAGDLIGYSKLTRDLTEKKQTDDKLKEYLTELQKQNEELDRFAYAASHDLQEPLRKIQTFADMLEQHLGDEAAARKYLQKINTASERMSSLIHSILEYSRLTKPDTERVDTDLNMILQHVLGDFELLIQQKGAKIRSGKLPVIEASPHQINQLFANLISNALKYSGKDPLIKINATIVDSSDIPVAISLPAGTQYHQLTFSDNGIGFEPQYAQLIFTLFQRLHGRHEFSGTGIGLALCKKIMDNHGGYIHAEGKSGEGATFYMYFKVD